MTNSCAVELAAVFDGHPRRTRLAPALLCSVNERRRVNVALMDGDETRAAAVADPLADRIYWTDVLPLTGYDLGSA